MLNSNFPALKWTCLKGLWGPWGHYEPLEAVHLSAGEAKSFPWNVGF